jgi:AcrR family transcriptional regulator
VRGRAAVERRFGSRDELLEQAAEASRAGLRTRRERIVTGARPILHSAVSASLAWLVATEVLGHDQPFFAPIAAVITLGLTVGQRRRRAIELAIGVAVGITIADALVAAIGTGTWQIGIVVALAMVAAALVGGGSLLASQAGASAVLVATLQPPDGGFDFDRAVDALTGSGVALVVSSLLLPVNPIRLVGESAAPRPPTPRCSPWREWTERMPASWKRSRQPARPRACPPSAVDRSAASTATPLPRASSAGRSRTSAHSPAARCEPRLSTTRSRRRPCRP